MKNKKIKKIAKIKKYLWISFAIILLTSLLGLSQSPNKYYNYLIAKLENYYTNNNTIEFYSTLEKLTEYSIQNSLTENLIKFIRYKLSSNYKNPFINEKIADSLFVLGDLDYSKKTYNEILRYININSKISKSIISRIYYKISQINLLEGSIQDYLKNLSNSAIYEEDIEKKINLKLEYLKDISIYFQTNTNEILKDIRELLYDSQNLSLNRKEKIYINLTEIYDIIGLNQESQKIAKNILTSYNSLDSLLTQYKYIPENQKEILELIINQYPNVDAYYYQKLAEIYYKELNYQKAKELFYVALIKVSTKHEVAYNLAQINYQEKNFYEAKKYIDIAIKQNESPIYFELAGDIYKNIDKKQAIKLYQKAFELYQDIQSKANIRKKIKDLENN